MPDLVTTLNSFHKFSISLIQIYCPFSRSVTCEISLWCLQFSQKTNKNNSTWGTIVLKSNFFVHVLGELKIPKRHFENKWSNLNLRSTNASWKKRFGPVYFISAYMSVQANIKFHQSPYTLAPFHNSGYKKWTALLVRHAYKNQVHGQDKNTNFSWTNVYKIKHAQRTVVPIG